MQRLFATFPDGQPGLALLLMRLSLAPMLFLQGSSYLQTRAHLSVALSGSAALLVLVGLFTPFTAIFSVIAGALGLLFCHGCDNANGGFVIAITATLGMLGPGAYSLDARLYGRRQVIVPPSPDLRM